jgi:lipoyl(octanoyl) transferase
MHSLNKQVYIQNWGLIDYSTAFKQQEGLQKTIIEIKIANSQQVNLRPTPNYLVFCEHPHVYTLGKSGTKDHLLVNEAVLQEKQAAFFYTNRGGDMTYHGPGQLVLYPILDLENFFTDISRYLRLLEEAVIATLQDFNLPSGRIKGLTGVWIDPYDPQKARKICAIGIRLSKWVTIHGLALNVHPDLSYFEHIVPCGIPASKVTSMAIELGYQTSIQQVAENLQAHMVRLLESEVMDN